MPPILSSLREESEPVWSADGQEADLPDPSWPPVRSAPPTWQNSAGAGARVPACLKASRASARQGLWEALSEQ